MNKFNKIVSMFFLGCTTISLLMGCASNNGPEYIPEDKTIPTSPYYLVNNGVTEYEVIYPSGSTSTYMTYAINEFRTFFNQATGTNIQISSDDKDLNPNAYYISLGKTKLFNQSGIELSQNLGYSGYGIKLIEHNLFIYCGNLHNDEGVLNGVYRLLNDAFKFEVFASDEIYVEPTHTKKILKYDAEFLPTFDIRELAFYDVINDADYRRRMRQITRFGNSQEWVPNFYAHSQINMLVTRTKYEEEHPEWFLPIMSLYGNLHWGLGMSYNESTGKMEYSEAADELRDAMAYEVIEVLKKYPNQNIITLGEEDEPAFCTCDNCKHIMEHVAYEQSGMQILFINRVIDKVEEWVSANNPNREIQYVIFAYHAATITPPVKIDANGNYQPYSEYIWPHEKMYIEYAPISAAYDHSFYDYQNAPYKSYIDGWNYLAKGRISLWTYNTNFSNYFVNFNDFSAFESNVRFFSENGVYYYFGQGANNARVPTLSEMRIFVESNLIYDVNKESYDNLAHRFMNAYYKEAGEDMYKYMSLLRENYLNYQGNVKDSLGSIYSSICTAEIYTEPFVAKLKSTLDDALMHIEPLKYTDLDKYETLKLRIMSQYCSVYYIILKLWKSMYTDEQINEFKENLYYYADVNKYNRVAENGVFDSSYFG